MQIRAQDTTQAARLKGSGQEGGRAEAVCLNGKRFVGNY